MKSKVFLNFSRSDIVPEGAERIPWLEKHGKIPEIIRVATEADLPLWAGLKAIVDTVGNVSLPPWVQKLLETEVLKLLREDPKIPNSLDVSDLLPGIAVQVQAEEAKINAQVKVVVAKLRNLTPDAVLDPYGNCHPTGDPDIDGYAEYLLNSGLGIAGPVYLQALDVAKEVFNGMAPEVKTRKAAAKVQRQEELARNAEKVRLCVLDLQVGTFPENLHRAAMEHRMIYPAIRDEIQSRVNQALAKFSRTEGYGEPIPQTQNAPTLRAYRIRDALVQLIPDLKQAVALPGVEVKIGDFVKIDVESGRSKIFRTVVEVDIHHPLYPDHPFGCYILTEAEEDDL